MENLFDLFSLKGKTIWVAGGAGYLGQAIDKMLLGAGARVLCIDLADRAENLYNQFLSMPIISPLHSI